MVGKLEAFSDSGTDGFHWVFMNSLKTDIYGLHSLSPGDHLTIYNPDAPKEVIWTGNINFEFNSNRHPIPLEPSVLRQVINGCTVKGLQKNVDSELWSMWFFNGYPAEFVPADLFPNGSYPILNSSMFHSYSYDSYGTLKVQFSNGDVYQYSAVPKEIIIEFLDANSKGKYFIANIKDRFDSKKMTLPIRSVAPVTAFSVKPPYDPFYDEQLGRYLTEQEEQDWLDAINDPDGYMGETT